jgi:hypothetical protein
MSTIHFNTTMSLTPEGCGRRHPPRGLVLRTVGKGVLGEAFRNSIEAIETHTTAAPDQSHGRQVSA